MEINITEIVAPYLQNITDQAGNHLIVVEAGDLKEIVEKIVKMSLNKLRKDIDDRFL